MILLDTNAVIWLHHDHARAAGLLRHRLQLYVSPATLLELQVLTEAGRLQLRGRAGPRAIIDDERWALDDPPSSDWFDVAREVGWTRDVFDRLIVAHARLRRWRIATADALVIQHLHPHEYLEL